MKFLVFQHINVEHPGIFRDFMHEDSISWDTIELDEGDPIPELQQYDALLVMGGPMDVWQEDRHRWLIAEKQAIRQAVLELNMPFLGFCLGHQLLADALGGKVELMTEPEVGVMPVELTQAGMDSALLQSCTPQLNTLQWHGAAVTRAPDGAQILAQSELCKIQAMQIGQKAFSIQFHIEITDSTVRDWAEIPEYEQSLENSLGSDAVKKLQAETDHHLVEFNKTAKLIYQNFKQSI